MAWRPQLLLLSRDPAAATTAWPGGSSNSARRQQQHGLAEPYRCCYGAMLLLPPGEVATAPGRGC